ncbi:OmpA family protein [Myroides sp. DW712]|uniref:OmpA family protein n=1 Tax=Myroides sp. DW712 TaxID=3389800 RepID=UPI00397DB1DF
MKKIVVIGAMLGLLLACSKKNKDTEEVSVPENPVEQTQESLANAEKQEVEVLNIEDIPVSTADIGDFPFFTLPAGLQSLNKPFEKKFDVCFFPINGVMTPFEGRLYKIFVAAEQGEQFSKLYFERSMQEYLLSIGAVKIFDGEITREEYDRYNKQDPNKGDDGDIGYADQQIHFYVIRPKDQGAIYVQYVATNEGGALNVLQEADFKQTMTKVTADHIAKELTQQGKSILYIQFDVDQSILKKEAMEVVGEIAKALKATPTLTISIEGHTDNTGDAVHNRKLSGQRANAVKDALVQLGIESKRVTASGFGADKPLVENTSEANKAKNRRVELVRIN